MVRRYRKASGVLVMILAGLTLSIGALAGRQIARHEKEIALDQTPAAVRATIQSRRGMVEEIEMTTEEGQTIYEADVIVDGRRVEMRVAEDGSLAGQAVESEQRQDNEEGGEEQGPQEQAGVLPSNGQVPRPVSPTVAAQDGTANEEDEDDEAWQQEEAGQEDEVGQADEEVQMEDEPQIGDEVQMEDEAQIGADEQPFDEEDAGDTDEPPDGETDGLQDQ